MTVCMIPERTGADKDLARILKRSKTIAVVGISHREERDSNMVARYLKEKGYTLIPVNPKYEEVLGEKCYPDLKAVPVHIDVVDIFRNNELIPGVVDEAIAVGTDCIWMQQGLTNEEAADKARCAGIAVVMDRCIVQTHRFLEKENFLGSNPGPQPAKPVQAQDQP